MEKEIDIYLDRIEEIGGAVQAVEEGFMQREIQHKAYETQKKIESNEEIIVGLNQFKLEEEVNPDLLTVDEKLEQEQIDNLINVRDERNQPDVDRTLSTLREKASTDENLIPHILEAVKAYASIGEICNILRDEFGEFLG